LVEIMPSSRVAINNPPAAGKRHERTESAAALTLVEAVRLRALRGRWQKTADSDEAARL
jgi:hypothetical protein